MKKRVAILISGRGSNMAALIEAAETEDYPAEIVLVVSNVEGAAGLQRARASGIATATVASKPYGGDKRAFEEELDRVITDAKADFVCLAGFMRLLSAWFVDRWEGRLLNIHPSLLPAYKGLDTHARAIADGATVHGATVHFVTAGMDEGPIILQGEVPVEPGDTAETLGARVLAVEHLLYPDALRMIATDYRLV